MKVVVAFPVLLRHETAGCIRCNSSSNQIPVPIPFPFPFPFPTARPPQSATATHVFGSPAAVYDRGHAFSVLRLSESELSSIRRTSPATRLRRAGGPPSDYHLDRATCDGVAEGEAASEWRDLWER